MKKPERAQKQTLYRRWRPGRLATMAGQETVRTIVSNAATQNRLSHAYLLCGPRGTGKTSLARILAKMVNCPQAKAIGDACDECDECNRISEGNHPDVVEMDAATNRSLDDVRRLQDHVRYLPTAGRKRVVIIDEVHALDHRAIPALLKTLEEPPAHAMFIMCTTEADKIQATIVSRCQRHEFTRLRPAEVGQHLMMVAEAEEITVKENEVRAIAQACGGGMRDALNLLEQVALTDPNDPERLTSIGVYGDDRRALPVITLLLEDKKGPAITALNDTIWEGADLNMIKRSGTEILRHAVYAVNGEASSYPAHEETQQAIAKALENPTATPARVTLAAKLWSEADLRNESSSSLSLELAIMEACLSTNPYSTPKAVPQEAMVTNETPPRQINAANDQKPTTATVPSNDMEKRWHKTMTSLHRRQAGGFWIAPLLRDVRPSLVEQNQNGGLTLPFTNVANLQRFKSVLESREGAAIRMQIAEGTGTSELALEPVIASTTTPQQNGSTSSQTQQSNLLQTSPIAKAALSLNGRLLRD